MNSDHPQLYQVILAAMTVSGKWRLIVFGKERLPRPEVVVNESIT